jgi:hypothetical protein
MFYHNTRYRFKLAEQSPTDIAGGIIAASAMPRPQLMRRSIKSHSYLQHRLFDPQLYLADINPLVAAENVIKLGTYPWFRCAHEEFVSGEVIGGLRKWKDDQAPQLIKSWPGQVASSDEDIASSVRTAIQMQLALGCEAIILPSPMTRVPGQYADEARWIDAGLSTCSELRVAVPVFATVAIADTALRQMQPSQNPFLQIVTAQIASRPSLSGAYFVIAQESEDGYVCKNPDTLLSLLILVDDITRGAGREAIVNYMGTFGAVTFGIGARIWSTGFYRSQRRLRTSDMDDSEGRTYPRYYSAPLLGDIGVDEDLAIVARDPEVVRALVNTEASAKLNAVLVNRGQVGEVPEWEYRMTNTTAAIAHYNAQMSALGIQLEGVEPSNRVEVVHRMLRRAESLASRVRDVLTRGRRITGHTDVTHQTIWRQVFETWRGLSGL